MKPVMPTMKVTTPAMTAMWKAAKPPVNPFWAEYITVTKPSSLPIMVATARRDLSDRPATM